MTRDFLIEHAAAVLLTGGLLIGLVFGAVVHRTNFCTMGALSDLRTFGDRRRLQAWMLAIAVAILGTQGLSAAGLLALDKAMYTQPAINWAGSVLGGLMFGYGMVFAGGCPSRNASRLGAGDLRALVVLAVTGLVAYMAIGGIFAPARLALETATALAVSAPMQTVPAVFAHVTGSAGSMMALAFGGGSALLLAALTLTDRAFVTSPKHVLSGLLVGLCVVAGWALTALLYDDFADRPLAPISLTFVRPSGGTIEWLARYTAIGLPSFGVATLLGSITGAFLSALTLGRFRIAGFTDTDDTVRHLLGSTLMGVGGVMAMGCSIGQGVTGVSTLAIGSLIAIAAIVAGAWFGLGALERRIDAAA